jgi:predicted DNA-binding ribbon-helix-helix protein
MVSLRRIPLPKEAIMQSAIVKRSIVVAGHKTSVSLEDAFWNGLKEIGKNHKMTLSDLVGDIDARRQHGNLSSAIRLFVLDRVRAQRTSADRVGSNMDVPQPPPAGHQSQRVNGRTDEHPEP